MSLSSRGARAAARSLRTPRQLRPARRPASHDAGHGYGEGATETAYNTDPGVNPKEGFGVSIAILLTKEMTLTADQTFFYLCMASIPTFWAVYTYNTPDNFLQRMIDQYRENGRLNTERDVLHTHALQQAVADRALFMNRPTNYGGPEWRYPE
jgi:hypothetical protein